MMLSYFSIVPSASYLRKSGRAAHAVCYCAARSHYPDSKANLPATGAPSASLGMTLARFCGTRGACGPWRCVDVAPDAANYLYLNQKVIMAKLLIVDDEPNVLNALRRMCLNSAHAPTIPDPYVTTFTSPLHALAHMHEHPVDLVISDFRMPEMDGASFLTKARKLQPHCARIIISANADIDGILRAVNEAGIFQFVSKPWSDHELKTAIVQVLAYRSLQIENHELANEVRRQRGLISKQQQELDRLEMESPGITRVRWSDDGGVMLEM
jgi:CheY-like chemotaxis protein